LEAQVVSGNKLALRRRGYATLVESTATLPYPRSCGR
jgi:hypothetical protein